MRIPRTLAPRNLSPRPSFLNSSLTSRRVSSNMSTISLLETVCFPSVPRATLNNRTKRIQSARYHRNNCRNSVLGSKEINPGFHVRYSIINRAQEEMADVLFEDRQETHYGLEGGKASEIKETIRGNEINLHPKPRMCFRISPKSINSIISTQDFEEKSYLLPW